MRKSWIKEEWKVSTYSMSGIMTGFLLTLAFLAVSLTPSWADGPCPYHACSEGQSCGKWYNNDPDCGCCVYTPDAEKRPTNLKPPFPRVAMQRPSEPQVSYRNCQPDGPSDGATPYMHSRYDLVAFCGFTDGCQGPAYVDMLGNAVYVNSQKFAEEIKSYSPETIVLGKAGYSPLHLYDDAPQEYFVMKDKTAITTHPVGPDSTTLELNDTSFFYGNPGWLTFIGDDTFRFDEIDGNTLNGIRQLDVAHNAGETVRQPLEVFGNLPNLMPFNPLADYRDVARLAVDQRYDGLTPDDFTYFDGVFYSEFRDRILCADDICGATYWGRGDWGADCNNNGIRDCNCEDTGEYTMSYMDEQWHIGVKTMFEYERQKLQELMPGRPPIIVTNSGDYPHNYLAEVNNGFQLEYLRKIYCWSIFVDRLRHWEEHAQEPHAIVIIDTIKEGDGEDAIEEGRNDFAQMRYGLATAMMGDAYYGRNFGWYHYIGLWYDEYETDLGYPLGPPVALEHLHTDAESTGIGSDWATYESVHVRFFDNGAVIVNPTATPQVVTSADLQMAWELAGFTSGSFPQYYRLRGGQDPEFNNGEAFTSVVLRGDPGPAPQGCGDDKSDAILLSTRPTTAVADIVIGNWHNDDTSPGSNPVELDPRDEWETIIFSDEKYGANPYYTQWVAGWTAEGIPYFYTTGGGKTATFRPTVGVPGNYDVYEWHGWHADRNEGPETHQEASNIRATIVHADGTAHVTVDQTTRYGQWNYLGTYRFNTGTDGYVRYTTDGADGVVIADAVMYRFADTSGGGDDPPSGNHAPVAYNSRFTTSADTSVSGILNATDADGDALTYAVVSNGFLGTAALTNVTTGAFTYTPNPGTSGTDTFTFKANDAALDSNTATVTITITPSKPPSGGGVTVSNVDAESGRSYVVVEGGLQNGSLCYTDRDYTYSNVPEFLEGGTYIETANDDKDSQGGTFLTFTVDRDVTVYVAHDDRYTTKPDWMADFEDTGFDITTDKPFSLYKKDFPAGTIVLGGNAPGEIGKSSMYTVIIVPRGTSDPGGGSEDTDVDGMPDSWETTHGLDPHDPSDASLDGDADGFTNLAEYQGGTNPNDSKDHPNMIVAGMGEGSGGWSESVYGDYTKRNWLRVDWPAYNGANGETRVATGDIDGDGRDEIILGLAPVSGDSAVPGGWFEVLDDDESPLGWGRVSWSSYNSANGETWPVCGDVDGDGLDEILIGLGSGGSAWVEVLDYDSGRISHKTWVKVNWSAYAEASGETRPVCGDIDGDGVDEIIVGLSSAGQGWIQVFDDGSAGFGFLAWQRVQWSAYNSTNGETRPACGDIDGDGVDEIVVGLGSGGDGWMEAFDYEGGKTCHKDWVRVTWKSYNGASGETRPVCGDIDGDGRDEIVVGLGKGGNGYMEVLDDASKGYAHLGWPRIHWTAYDNANGETWPAVK